MSRSISRRKFIQLGGLAGTAFAVSGCTVNLQRSEMLEPYVVPPEEALPGQNVWYASTCGQCPAGCGIIVRVSNGRARKIEGNPRHPLNRGKLCARGQAGLQVLYNPDRLRNAVRQNGRGSLLFDAVAWDEALGEVAGRLQAARPGAVAYLGQLAPDGLASVVDSFMTAVGGRTPVFFDPLSALEGRGTLSRAVAQLFGTDPQLPMFDLAESDITFSFGANFAESWLSPVAYSRAFGQMRGGTLGKRGYLVQFEPRMSATAAVADEWIPLTPGIEGLVAMAIGQIIVSENLGTAQQSPLAPSFRDFDVDGIATASGVPAEKLAYLARAFARFERPLAIPGGSLSGHTNGAQSTLAVLALGQLVAAQGAKGPISLPTASPIGGGFGTQPSTFAQVEELLDAMRDGAVDVLFVHGNPLHEQPLTAGIAEALARVSTVVSFASYVDETAAQADLILPDHTPLEQWGYLLVSPPGDRPILSAQQPVVSALYDTRATTDVFLALSDSLGGPVKQALPWANSVELIKEALGKVVGQDAPFATTSLDAVWSGWRQFGGWWPNLPARVTPDSPARIPEILELPRPRFDGEGGDYPFLLYPYLSPALGDGRGATQPWLQETPDPMTTGSWDTWVEINPETAVRLGLKQDDLVKIVSPHSEIVAIVYEYRGIRPDVVAVPLGQGHSASGRYAANRGANVMSLLGSLTSDDGELAWAATRVRLEATGRRRVLPRIESNVGVDFANEHNQLPG